MIQIFSSMWRRPLAAGMLALLLVPTVSKTADARPAKNTPAKNVPAKNAPAKNAIDSSGAEAPQPKFIWGILIKFAATKAFEIFSEWAFKTMFQGMTSTSKFSLSDAVSAAGAAVLGPSKKSFEPIVPNVTDSAPTAPVVVDGGRENYQGVHLALLVLQPDGQSFQVRPISEGFKTGEKFRIRLGATFDGELSLDNINPQGKRERLYPANVEQVVKIKHATPVILPLDKDSFFEFDDVAGEEQLVITLRDPRAQGEAIAQAAVHRQENEQGTGLLQEVAAGKYAAIAEAIALQHH